MTVAAKQGGVARNESREEEGLHSFCIQENTNAVEQVLCFELLFMNSRARTLSKTRQMTGLRSFAAGGAGLPGKPMRHSLLRPQQAVPGTVSRSTAF